MPKRTTAYLGFIAPVNIKFSLETLQRETQTSSPSLSRSLHDLLASLIKLTQTLALSEAHFGLKV